MNGEPGQVRRHYDWVCDAIHSESGAGTTGRIDRR